MEFTMNRKEYLAEYLNYFWLRPENAVMLAIRAEKYASTFDYLKDYSLDVSCGDGVFSFIAAGGKIGASSDMFQSLNLGVRKGAFDAFDSWDSQYSIDVIQEPEFGYSHGIDWKQNLLRKAEALNFYGNLSVHDNNKTLPYDDNYFSYIYSNSTYWVESFEKHIIDLYRVLKPGGHMVLEIKTKNIFKFSASVYAHGILGPKAYEILDAGRSSTWKGMRDLRQYDQIFSALPDVEIVKKEPVYGDLLAQIWDIGMRPLFNPLVKLANSVDLQTRKEAKKEWCQTLYDLTEDLVCDYTPKADSAIEWIYVLRKGN